MRRIGSRGPRVAGIAALAVVLVAATAVTIALSSHGSAANSAAGGTPASRQHQRPSLATATASLAAAWVDQQVSHDAVVACDQVMCDALAAHGFPGRHLKLIRPGAPYPVRAQVVIETPLVARQFGSRNVDLAPAVLITVGHGGTAVTVRVVAPQGSATYAAALKANLRQRRAAGTGLLTSRQVRASPVARKQLISGAVDARLIVGLTALASRHPIDILSFGTEFPGASADVPLRTAHLARNDPAAGMSNADYLRFLLIQLDAQPGIYRPDRASLVHTASGMPVFQITFLAPSPLRLLG